MLGRRPHKGRTKRQSSGRAGARGGQGQRFECIGLDVDRTLLPETRPALGVEQGRVSPPEPREVGVDENGPCGIGLPRVWALVPQGTALTGRVPIDADVSSVTKVVIRVLEVGEPERLSAKADESVQDVHSVKQSRPFCQVERSWRAPLSDRSEICRKVSASGVENERRASWKPPLSDR